MAKKKGTTTASNHRRKDSLGNIIRNGRGVSVEYLKKNVWLLIVFLVLVISLMGMRYKTKTKMAEINKLEQQLSLAESERLLQKSEYMSLIRENEMIKLVEKKNLGLTFQEQPPYELSLSPESDKDNH